MSTDTNISVVTDMALVAWLLSRNIEFAGSPTNSGGRVEFPMLIDAETLKTMQRSFMLSPERRFFSTYLDVKKIVSEIRGR
jgi:hypothetical protein